MVPPSGFTVEINEMQLWLDANPPNYEPKKPVSALLPSSADFYSFSLSGRFRAIGLAVLVSLSTRLYTLPN